MEESPVNSEYFIVIESSLHPASSDQLLISGKFKVKYDNGITVKGAQVLKHIVLVVTRSGNYQSFSPFKDMAVFVDDIKDEGDGCSGFFNVNLADYIGFGGAGSYFIVSSLGNYLSNTLNVKVK